VEATYRDYERSRTSNRVFVQMAAMGFSQAVEEVARSQPRPLSGGGRYAAGNASQPFGSARITINTSDGDVSARVDTRRLAKAT